MPSPLSRKKTTSKKPGIIRKRNFQPALKAVKSLVDDFADSEDPEDHELKMKLGEQTQQSSPSLTRNFTSHRGHENKSKNQSQTVSSELLLKRTRLLDGFDSDSESEGSGDDSVEQQTETREITEVERLEEVQTDLEERIKRTKELLQRTDRTRNQRMHGQQRLRRLELKLEKLDQRLEMERAGKSRWTFVRRVLRKPKVGFHSSDLLNRKVPLPELLAASSDNRPHLVDVVLQEMELNAAVQNQVDDNPPPKPKKLFKSKELHEFEKSLKGDEAKPENRVVDCATDGALQIGATQHGWGKIDDGEELLESFKQEQQSDRKEMDKGWLRISDRPDGFIKKIQDVSDTKQSKEAWVNINDQGNQMFARKVFRAHVNADSFLSRSLDGRRSTLSIRGEKLSVDGRMSVNSSKETLTNSKDKSKEGQVGRTSSSPSPRKAKVVKMDTVAGTDNFLPPIPKSEAKKRPKEEQVEKVKDENDGELQKEKILLIPNRKRLVKKRIEIYLKQLEFVKSHKLDKREVLKNVVSSVEDYHGDRSREEQEHEAKTTPRHTLYLIGALSKNHLRPPTAPPK